MDCFDPTVEGCLIPVPVNPPIVLVSFQHRALMVSEVLYPGVQVCPPK
jgi:hypothetical protein